MNLQKTYMELLKSENDDYYIELAQKEILVTPILIEMMLDRNNSKSRWAGNLIEKISEKAPMIVYPYFEYISTVFDNEGITAWNCWKIIANLLPVDLFEKWEKLKEKYLLSFSSDMITEYLIVLSVADKIIAAKPKDKSIIISAIENSRKINFSICGEVSTNSRTIADEYIQMFYEKLEQ